MQLEPEPEPEPEPKPEPELEPEPSSDSLDEYNWDDDMLFGAQPPPLQVLGAYSELPAFEMPEFDPPIRYRALPPNQRYAPISSAPLLRLALVSTDRRDCCS
jgi:hypothetical protein